MSTHLVTDKPVAHRPAVSWVLGHLGEISAECVLFAPPALSGDLVVAHQWWDSTGGAHLSLVNLGPIHSVEVPTTERVAYAVTLQSAWEAFKRGEIRIPLGLHLSLVKTMG